MWTWRDFRIFGRAWQVVMSELVQGALPDRASFETAVDIAEFQIDTRDRLRKGGGKE